MSNLTAEGLVTELFSEAMFAQDQGFTLIKNLGIVQTCLRADGTLGPASMCTPRTRIEMNAAAVRMLAVRFPTLKITYPQTLLSEKTVLTGGEPLYITETRTDAVIDVPETFVQTHCGTAFRRLLLEQWHSQLDDLTSQLIKRLRRHELRTVRMFGSEQHAAAVTFRITADTAESDIWVIPLAHCGFYPLQWDGEICGMALLLAQQLQTALAADCGSLLETAVRRDALNQQCAVTLYFTLKQD